MMMMIIIIIIIIIMIIIKKIDSTPEINDKFGSVEIVWMWKFKLNFAEAYWEPCQTSKMERFAKLVNGWLVLVVNYFLKTLHVRRLTGFWKLFLSGFIAYWKA